MGENVRRKAGSGLAIDIQVIPKAILTWIAIMSLALRPAMPAGTRPAIIGDCAFLGTVVFGGYAVLFSTEHEIALYARIRCWIEGGLSALFAVAGLELIISDG